MDEFKDKISVLLGITGVGKSSFINAITKKKICKVGDGSDSCTQKIVQADVANNGYNYYFVDTPGLDDEKGDEKNIKELDNIKKKCPRINVFIFCLKFDDLRLTNSIKNSLIKFMELFPTPSFWEHVIFIRTHADRSNSKKFERNKKKIEGKFLEGILKNEDLNKFMEENNIHAPSQIKEFFVDVDPEEEELDPETLEEFENIFGAIRNVPPIYKEVVEEIEEYVSEEKDKEFTFINIKTIKHIKFKDFDGEEHEADQVIGDEKYNLDGIRPLLTEVKRVQEDMPRGILCWKNQFKTNYYLVKYYEIKGERKRVQCHLEYRWESKDLYAEIQGEEFRKKLNQQYTNNTCRV